MPSSIHFRRNRLHARCILAQSFPPLSLLPLLQQQPNCSRSFNHILPSLCVCDCVWVFVATCISCIPSTSKFTVKAAAQSASSLARPMSKATCRIHSFHSLCPHSRSLSRFPSPFLLFKCLPLLNLRNWLGREGGGHKKFTRCARQNWRPTPFLSLCLPTVCRKY